MAEYSALFCRSSSCVPDSIKAPSSNTYMQSAKRHEESLWDMYIIILSLEIWFMSLYISLSANGSRAAVGSSSIMHGEFLYMEMCIRDSTNSSNVDYSIYVSMCQYMLLKTNANL